MKNYSVDPVVLWLIISGALMAGAAYASTKGELLWRLARKERRQAIREAKAHAKASCDIEGRIITMKQERGW